MEISLNSKPFVKCESDNVYIFKIGKEFLCLSLNYRDDEDSLNINLRGLKLNEEEFVEEELFLVESDVVDSKCDFDWLVLESFELAGNPIQKFRARWIMEYF
jgi:hypothetical protein